MANEITLFSGKPPEGEYAQKDRGAMGKQLIAKYPNGYGASVIQSRMSYGGSEGKFELAVLHGFPDGGIMFDDDTGGELCYATPITDDVRGWLTQEMVVADLIQISELPSNDTCDHDRPGNWDPFNTENDENKADFMQALDSLGRAW